jgi:hypothetical protein
VTLAGQQGLAGRDHLDRREQLAGARVLEQESARSGAQRRVDVFVEIEGGEDEDPDGGGGQPAGRLDSVHAGHPDVHEHHVGLGAAGHLDGLLPGAGLTDDGESGCRGKNPAQSGPDQRLVVGDEHAYGHRVPSCRGMRAVTRNPPSARGPAANRPR